jgi:phosphate transport system protein
MSRELLDYKIKQLQGEVLFLGNMVDEATRFAVESLKNQDQNLAQKILEGDRLINEKRYAIENNILITIATQQPMAHDLRLLAAILEIISELERMGDYAKGIAKITKRMGNAKAPIPIQDLSKMAELDIKMLHKALTAFIHEDYHSAASLPKEDDAVDAIYNKIFHELMKAMTTTPSFIDNGSLILWAAHNLERLGDRVTNICERTIFIATGELFDMDTSEGEEPDREISD